MYIEEAKVDMGRVGEGGNRKTNCKTKGKLRLVLHLDLAYSKFKVNSDELKFYLMVI